MAKQPKQRSPTIKTAMVVRMVGAIVGTCCILPALYYNLDKHQVPGALDNAWAVGLTILSALVAEGMRHLPTLGLRSAALGLAVLLVFNNGLNAFGNLSRDADHRTDHRKTAMVGANNQWSERSGWSAKVDQARKIVGDKPASTYKADADGYQQLNAPKWNATKGCAVEHISLSRDFCSELQRLRGLAKTAKERDDGQEAIRAIDKAMAGVVVPTNADPQATNLKLILGMFTSNATEEGIRAFNALLKTMTLEGAATFGPVIIWAMFSSLAGWIEGRPPSAAPAHGQRQQQAGRQVELKVAPAAEATPAASARLRTPEFDRYVADALEEGSTYTIEATPAYELYRAWCGRHDLEPVSQKRFGPMMAEAFIKDRNHGYPRYLGVRQRPPVRDLRLAVSN